MFKDNRTALYDRDGATDKNCRSRAENDKDQIKSELLFARQPDLVAALTSVPFPPLSPFYGNNEAKFRSLIFFQQTNADCSSTTQSQISADLFAGRAQTHRQRRRTWDQAVPRSQSLPAVAGCRDQPRKLSGFLRIQETLK
jgi:hypothetical protein